MERYKPDTEKGESSEKKDWNSDRKHYDSSEEWMVEQEMIRSTIESFDEEVFFEVLKELAGKSGVDIDTINLPSLDQVKVTVDSSYSGAGFNSYVETGINETALPHTGSRVSVDKVLWAVVHEYLHILSTAPFENHSELNNDTYKNIHVGKTGVQINAIGDEFELNTKNRNDISAETNRYINEGITEWLTGRVFDEYVNRVGDNQIRQSESSQRVEEMRGGSYWVERLNIELYILFLSELLEQPVSIIENSITRTYLRNGEVVPEEIIEVLNVSLNKQTLVLNLLKDKINEPDFALLLLDLQNSLPEDKRQKFEEKVAAKFQNVADAVEINNKKYT